MKLFINQVKTIIILLYFSSPKKMKTTIILYIKEIDRAIKEEQQNIYTIKTTT
jgi:hypothetical protein